jgi:glycosyltransferase involved in cell wall biosynthesis
LEARACGLITIAKSKTGSQEVIRDNIDGFLVDESIGGSLKKCLGKVYDKNFDYRRFSELAIERTNEDFNMSKNYEKIYNIVSGY